MAGETMFSHNSDLKDEQHSPAYIVQPLIEIIKQYYKDKTIWCPWDGDWSEYVKMFKREGFNVVNSHIDDGKDFYKYEPENWDILISNPPFSDKAVMMERVLSFNKPFAVLLPAIWINDSAPSRLFGGGNKDLQMLLFDKRTSFKGNKQQPTFMSVYYCWNFLPKQIIFKQLDKEFISSEQRIDKII